MSRKQPEPIKDIRPSMTTYYRPVGAPAAPQPDRSTPEPEQKHKKSWRKRIVLSLLVLLAVILVPLTIIFIMDVRNFSSAAEKLFGTSNVLSMFPPSELKKSSDGNVHMLIAGYSADDPGHGGSNLTDTIMVLTINPKTGKGYMLSIPRDLYVEIPGNGSAKINEVYQDGESSNFSEQGYPAGGMGLLTKVVEEVTGTDIQYNYLVNYAAVRDIVTALGGVTIAIQSPDPRGIYDPGFKPEEGGALQLPNGPSKIDGQTALKITRARGLSAASYGFPQADFNRTQYQQALMVGIIKELSWRAVLNPRQNQALFDSVANNVQTNLQINEVIPMFRVFMKVDVTKLSTQTLRSLNGTNYVTSYRTSSGQSALVPIAGMYDYSEIHAGIKILNASIAQ